MLSRIKSIRGGKLNDPRFGSRMKGEGIWADVIKNLFQVAKQQAGMGACRFALSTTSFRRPGQRSLFD